MENKQENQTVVSLLNTMALTTEEKNASLKREILSIMDSYGSNYDILIEATQNMVDEIERNDNCQNGNIKITYDAHCKKLIFRDNGNIHRENIEKIFTPNFSTKLNGNNLRGEKGVGTTFMVFSTNFLELETCDGTYKTIATIKGANDWLCGKTDKTPDIVIDDPVKCEHESYTEFRLINICQETGRGDEENPDIFQYTSIKQLEFDLRSKTAIGNTKSLWNETPIKDINIELDFINKDGKKETCDIPYSFYILHNINCISSEKRLQDKLKNNENAGKPTFVIKRFPKVKNGKDINIYMFVGKSQYYNDLNNNGIKLETENRGMYVSCKNMPTPIKLNWQPDKQGYIANIFGLVEYDGFTFDTGRKNIKNSGVVTKFIKKYLDDVYKEFFKFNMEYIIDNAKDEVRKAEDELAIDEMWDKLGGASNISIYELPFFKKEPNEEQDVVCLFSQMLGANIIKGYEIWGNFVNKQYDCFCKVYTKNSKKPLSVIIEFKTNASDLLREVGISSKKDFSKIKVLVCWQLGCVDDYAQDGFQCEEHSSELYDSITHRLWNNSGEIMVINLKTLVEKYKNKKGQIVEKLVLA